MSRMSSPFFSAESKRCFHFFLGAYSLYDVCRLLNESARSQRPEKFNLGTNSFCIIGPAPREQAINFFATAMLVAAFGHSGLKMLHYGATGNLTGFYPYIRNTMVGVSVVSDIEEALHR